MSRAGRPPKPVRVVPSRARRLRQRRLRARLTAALALVASVTIVQGAIAVRVQPAGDVVPIALKLEAPAPPGSRPGPTPAQVALAEDPGPDWPDEGRGGHARRVAATAKPLTRAEIKRALRGLELDRATRRQLTRLLLEIPQAPLDPPS